MKDLFQKYTIGHFINQPSNPTEFEITRFEEMAEPEVEDVHKHTFYEILWVDEGYSRQVIDYQTYDLGPKSLFFISPGQVHEFESWQELKGGTIFFTEDFFLYNAQNKDKLFELTFLDNVYFNPQLLLGCQEYALFRNYIHLLLTECQRPEANTDIVRSLLHILLLQVQRSIETQQTNVSSRRSIVLFKQFRQLLESHFAQGLTAENYADQLHITPHHLNRVVKEITSKKATEVIRSRSILEAKRLLSFSDAPVTEIAASLSYFDASYFSKIFKRETGKTPLAFRSEMSEKYRIR